MTDTPALTAEQRALRIVEKLREPFANSPDVALFARIASAIREAEDAAYERAASEATKFLVGDPFNGVPLRSPGPHEIAAHIRSLKTKEN